MEQTDCRRFQWCTWKKNHNRTDDPLGADADKLTKRNHVQHMWDEGVVTKKATCKNTGEKTYTCTVCKETKTETIAKTNDHKYTWKTTAKATVFAPAKQQGKCSVCGKTVTKNYGKKLTATIRLNATSIRLQQRRSTNKIKVTMANGDSVKSWTSNNRRIATVNNKGVITAGRQNGTAKITVTLKSGKKASLNVKVQSTKVITTSISGLRSRGNSEARTETDPETSNQSDHFPGRNYLCLFQQECSSCKPQRCHYSTGKRSHKDYSKIRKEILYNQSNRKIIDVVM